MINSSPLGAISRVLQLSIIHLIFVVANKRFKRGIIGKYHITFAASLFSRPACIMASLPVWYREAWHRGHESKSL
jgi:hypothetical protein